ncbi:uncharacterized protein ACMZJ9_009897 [Mantella aurantiaca]
MRPICIGSSSSNWAGCRWAGWTGGVIGGGREKGTLGVTHVGPVPAPRSALRSRSRRSKGTSFAVLEDKNINSLEFSIYLNKVLTRLSSRFPCITRQYTSIVLDNADTIEANTTDKDNFLQIIKGNFLSTGDTLNYYQMLPCNQSLLYGLKRALEISPAESVIAVFTSGSMTDYNDAQLLSDIYTLLKEKKSQVYFLLFPGNCPISATQEEIFNNITSLSFGEFLAVNDYNYYQLVHSLELFLSKPLNSSVDILNIKLNIAGQYTDVFNVPTSLSYLLITRDDKFTIIFTDPNGNTITLGENPYIHFYYSNLTDSVFISSYLVRSPTDGSWTLTAWGNGSLTVQILGFTGNCSYSDCHPNATCGEFGGNQQCTCKVGFAGDGSYCDDIDECQDRYTNNCDFYGGGSCVNTIGSYTCNCNSGFQYKEEFGCVDIDECANSSLSTCLPPAVCINGNGTYTCTCPSTYYEAGTYSCTDPCSLYYILNDPWRSTSNVNNNDYYHCDFDLNGWYRFIGEYNQTIPERCVPERSCGTSFSFWLNGSHPTVPDGIVSRTACASGYLGCCTHFNEISVKMCQEGFYIYKIQGTPTCYSAYCTENQTNTPAEISTTVPPDITSETTGTPSNNSLTTSVGSPFTSAATHQNCKMREGTSFTVLLEKYFYWTGLYALDSFLDFPFARFPCVTRQYASVALYNDETNETITTKKDSFKQTLLYEEISVDYSRYACNQSLLYGLKRALEISPAESVILVHTAGSMIDYNDAQLLSDVYTLLEEKKSQVYFLLIPGYCNIRNKQKEIFSNILSNSFGEIIIHGAYYQYSSYQSEASEQFLSRHTRIHKEIKLKYLN